MTEEKEEKGKQGEMKRKGSEGRQRGRGKGERFNSVNFIL